ncbi:MAG: DUF2442 domain-containing protein [Muribaculaceae bacterium]|nr:DUF2442 domain-containing protein [Muribaculaceae bacterium]
MEKIIKDVWFNDERIYMETNTGEIYSRQLEAFPILKEASDEDRQAFTFDMAGDAIRWPLLDEDIHISSFFEPDEPIQDNEIRAIFRRFPQLNVSQVAHSIGINSSLLAAYIYGTKQPSKERIQLIKDGLHSLGHQLSMA